MNRISELDGLRAIAIFLVIVSHYGGFAVALSGVAAFGWIGVDIFFVLSGFLITQILLKLRHNPRPLLVFYTRRTIRIFPPYFLVLIAVLGLATVLRPEKWHLTSGLLIHDALFSESLTKSSDVVARAIASVRMHSILPLNVRESLPLFAPFLPKPQTPFELSLGPMWSLSVEEWFYIIWGIIALKFRSGTLVLVALFGIATCILLRWFGFNGANWYFAFPCRVDTLLVGSLLAIWVEKKANLTPRRARIGDNLISFTWWICMGLLVLILFRISPVAGREIRASLLFAVLGVTLLGIVTAGGIMTIVRVQSSNAILSRLLRAPMLTYIGQRSYMIYLIHSPVYFAVDRACNVIGMSKVSSLQWIIAWVSLGLSLSLASLSWRFFETPILAQKNRWAGLLEVRLQTSATRAPFCRRQGRRGGRPLNLQSHHNRQCQSKTGSYSPHCHKPPADPLNQPGISGLGAQATAAAFPLPTPGNKRLSANLAI